MVFRSTVNGVAQCNVKHLDGLTIKGVDRDSYLAELQATEPPLPTKIKSEEEPIPKRLKLEGIYET